MKVELQAMPHAVEISLDGHRVTIEGASGDAAEAAMVLGVLPALEADGVLQVSGEVGLSSLENIRQAAAAFAAWSKRPPLTIEATTRPDRTPKSGVAAFFSGGVDSYYTALTAPDVEALIFVHGFDVPLEAAELRKTASANARQAAEALGKEFVEVVTDVRRYPLCERKWRMTHGAAMAAVAHALSDRFGKIYIPASYTYSDLFPLGSHPLTDPLWGGDRLRLVHHGADATRFQKLGLVSQSDVAARYLRVCWENRDGQYNCGRCEKCTRTMVGLRAYGVLDRFQTFDRPLDLWRVRLGPLNHKAAFGPQGISAVRALGDRELANALRWSRVFGKPSGYVERVYRLAQRTVKR